MSQASMSQLALMGLLVVAVGATTLADAHGAGPLETLNSLKERLDAVAQDKQSTSGITFLDLHGAFQSFENSEPKVKEEIRKNPSLRPVLDFALTPLRFLAQDLAENPTFFANHLARLEAAYKRFKPAYEGKLIGDTQIRVKIDNNLQLYMMASGSDKETKPSMQLFRRAKREANAWRARFQELTTYDDIYHHLGELESIFNFINAVALQPLFHEVYPNLDQYNDPEQLMQLWHKSLWCNQSIKFGNGSWERYENAQKSPEDGCSPPVTAEKSAQKPLDAASSIASTTTAPDSQLTDMQ